MTLLTISKSLQVGKQGGDATASSIGEESVWKSLNSDANDLVSNCLLCVLL